jgi:tyrosine-protein phosphatase YwqE
MFRFFSKSRAKGEKVDYSVFKTDMHSHLLPGIDDGAKDMETSVELIRGMSELGYKKLITTPHITGYVPQYASINAKWSVREA